MRKINCFYLSLFRRCTLSPGLEDVVTALQALCSHLLLQDDVLISFLVFCRGSDRHVSWSFGLRDK